MARSVLGLDANGHVYPRGADCYRISVVQEDKGQMIPMWRDIWGSISDIVAAVTALATVVVAVWQIGSARREATKRATIDFIVDVFKGDRYRILQRESNRIVNRVEQDGIGFGDIQKLPIEDVNVLR